jgi:acyl-CoA reductase-like NAD-dependent aldehyde dehydrogenase
MSDHPLWINGRDVRTGFTRDVRVPYDGSLFAVVHQASAAHVEEAVESALIASRKMRRLSLDDRSVILRKSRELLLQRKEEMARAITCESGKPIKEGRLEVDRAASTLLFSSEEAHRLAGEVVPMDAAAAGRGRMGLTIREPLGVIAAITPFNFPLNLSVHKIGPAIAAGNAVVHKPASATPVSALLLARIFHDAGLPAGALNVLPGSGSQIGDALVQHSRVAMVTFTGSADVGLRIRSIAGLKRVTLELGNNSALIVHHDADLEDCIARAVPGAYAHSGQVCISVQRILVHRQVFDEFADRFAEAASALHIGSPLDEATDVSSLITEAEARRVEQWLGESVRLGALKIAGGERHGATLSPTVLTDVPESSALWAREAFGPVAGINAYSTLEEAVDLVNRSDYGLQAGIFTKDLEAAFYAARECEVGGFLINDVPQFRVDQMPYGGVKLSGTGREGPRYAVEEMTEPKLITWRV